MSTSAPDILRSLYAERRAKNERYSTRAFARDLGISQALLSLVWNGKRPLTPKQALRISSSLAATDAPRATLLEQTAWNALKAPLTTKQRNASVRTPSRAVVLHALDQFKVISHWYHLAILDLTTTRGFKSDAGWIAKRLCITRAEARDAIQRLLDLGLLRREGEALRKTSLRIHYPTQRSVAAVRQFHRQMIQKALQQLDHLGAKAFSARDISGITIAASRSKLPEAKRRILKFQRELAAFLSADAPTDVYQLNIQLFPITQEMS